MGRQKNTTAEPTSDSNRRVELLEKKIKLMEIELAIYREIGGFAVKKIGISQLLNRLMDFVLKAMETDAGTLYLVDEVSGELRFEVVKGPAARRLKGMKMRMDYGIAGEVARTGRPYVTQNLETDSLWLGLKTDKYHQTSLMAVPLKIKNKVIGVIEVINKTCGEPFTKRDLNLLTSLTNHFSIIMERANLFTELDSRIKQFSTLYDVGNLLISTLDQKTVRQRAMEAITKLMKAEAGSLLLVDHKTRELYFEVALGEKGEKVKEVRLRMGEGIAGWVARYGKPLLIDDVTKDRRFQKKVDEKSEFRTRNMICVPVKIKGNVIGVLQAINRIDGNFTKEDLQLFQLFSNQVAIALDNARLYEELREAFYATSEALADAIEKRDPYTGGHIKRVLHYSLAIARYLGLSEQEMEVLKLSAVLHDIGKIGIEDRILKKAAPLDKEEIAQMMQHPMLGKDILKHVPQLKEVIPGMLHHHERVDGKGYPMGLKDGKIPLIARIISVADTYDAMTTTRPYRKALPKETALAELERFAGIQFDRDVVRAFKKAFKNGDIDGVVRKRKKASN